MENYQNTIVVSAGSAVVYKALTENIANWWTELFEGNSERVGESFTIKFGDSVRKTFKVEELLPNRKVVWLVTDAIIDMPELTNKSEWEGTKIVWELAENNGSTSIHLTHIGLTPTIECYEICQAGWVQFIASLKALAETGVGNPFKGAKV